MSADLAPLESDWRRLAQYIPFRRFDWNQAWWRHYGDGNPRAELLVLTVRDENGRTIGIAPWYIQRHRSLGRVLGFLGDGEVCGDYLSVLCDAPHVERVTTELAQWLVTDGNGAWELIRLRGVEAQDSITSALVDALAQRGALVHRRFGPSCWRLALPRSWDDYEALLSKSHRKQIRRLVSRQLDTGRARLVTLDSPRQFDHAWNMLVDLHQRRRKSLGEPGCFASEWFAAFHREIAQTLLAEGSLRLSWLELEGRPVAAEYQLAGGDVTYAYQSGVCPDALAEEPGRLITLATIRKAIEEHSRVYDFLRGDEPYKAHLRAEPRETVELRIVPRRVGPRIRHHVWLAGARVRQLWRARP